jgi:hypothetical protein
MPRYTFKNGNVLEVIRTGLEAEFRLNGKPVSAQVAGSLLAFHHGVKPLTLPRPQPEPWVFKCRYCRLWASSPVGRCNGCGAPL